MNIRLSPRAWLILLAIDVVAFALIGVGLATGTTLIVAAGGALVICTSVAGVMTRRRPRI
jgi:F0F1-type ATP synthase membrane subunit c/vacuolar-type H+-ATPase subunit K